MFPGGSGLQKISKIQKNPKSFANVFKRVLNMFWAIFLKSFFYPVFHGVFKNFRKNQKSFQISKNAQNRSRKCPILLWTCFGAIFSRKNYAKCSMEGRALKNFQKIQKNFKIPKLPIMVSKGVQTCFEQTLGRRFWKFFCPVFDAVHFKFSGLKIMSSDSPI